MYVTPAIAFSV